MLTWVAGASCQSEYDEPRFREAIETAYREAHPGWAILRRDAGATWFHRGDQVDELRVSDLFSAYRASHQSGAEFVRAWKAEAASAYASLRRRLGEAEDLVIPIIKSEKWVQYQDLGAIGPQRKRAELRPWRTEIAPGVFAVLGVPEDKLGFRFASMAEVDGSDRSGTEWLRRATQNLVQTAQDRAYSPNEGYLGVDIEVKQKLMAFDLENVDGISGLVLDRGFREAMLEKFGRSELGAAVPIRNVLIVFRPDDFVAVKPARNRARQLYDTQNHPGFRGLRSFDAEGLGVLEPGTDERGR